MTSVLIAATLAIIFELIFELLFEFVFQIIVELFVEVFSAAGRRTLASPAGRLAAAIGVSTPLGAGLGVVWAAVWDDQDSGLPRTFWFCLVIAGALIAIVAARRAQPSRALTDPDAQRRARWQPWRWSIEHLVSLAALNIGGAIGIALVV